MSTLRNAIGAAVQTLESLFTLEPQLDEAGALVRECLAAGHKLLVCGNGGSAADGADFATEFSCRFVEDRQPFPAINLASSESLVTAIGNDYGFDEIFARQVRAFGKEGDVLVAISTSGNSRNVLRAVEEATAAGIFSIALLGGDGGCLRGRATVEFLVPSQTTARVQEAHKFLLHVLCEMVEPALKAEPNLRL
ncbi:MAG: D-sedoheptulose 7-phosphate isomerase [Chthoniobacter sp.]|jgi:D-sedoheptulose 7-phosphate isomerase|nr:D-sedoheptulose 7-phosphate isomerase [Chthoniobacter sp.]